MATKMAVRKKMSAKTPAGEGSTSMSAPMAKKSKIGKAMAMKGKMPTKKTAKGY